MIHDVDVLYEVPKDLAFRFLKSKVAHGSVRLAFYKSCLDRYITRKTLWNIMPLVVDGGALAVHCNYHTLSHLVDFAEAEGYTYDVVFFHGSFKGSQQSSYRGSVVPFVLVYKGKRVPVDMGHNLLELASERPLEEIACKLLLSETEVRDLVLFVGDAAMMAASAKRLMRYVVVFGDDPVAIGDLTCEGVVARRVKL